MIYFHASTFGCLVIVNNFISNLTLGTITGLSDRRQVSLTD